jgi:hypothetical protein
LVAVSNSQCPARENVPDTHFEPRRVDLTRRGFFWTPLDTPGDCPVMGANAAAATVIRHKAIASPAGMRNNGPLFGVGYCGLGETWCPNAVPNIWKRAVRWIPFWQLRHLQLH